VEIWVNPACSKCRTATAALDQAGLTYTVRRYLEEPPSRAEIERVLGRLGLEPWDITRTREPEAKELGLATVPRDAGNRERWLDALASHPRLIQRPIITADDGTTVVGRDPESLRRVLPE
jgi:arsenate reductase